MKKICKLYQHFSRQRDGAGFILGIGILRDMEQFRDLSLLYVVIFSNASQILKYHYLFTFGLFGFGWMIDTIVLLFKPNPYYV